VREGCKQRGPTRKRGPWLRGAAIAGGALLAMSACSLPPRVHTVSLQALEAAPPTEPFLLARTVATDAEAFEHLGTALGPRLMLVEARTPEQWESLARVLPRIRAQPDLRRGSVIALISEAGTPLEARWPIGLDSVQIADGGGLLHVRFAGGTYLPDGRAYVEAVYVPGLAAVLVVEVNGVRFYPHRP